MGRACCRCGGCAGRCEGTYEGRVESDLAHANHAAAAACPGHPFLPLNAVGYEWWAALYQFPMLCLTVWHIMLAGAAALARAGSG